MTGPGWRRRLAEAKGQGIAEYVVLLGILAGIILWMAAVLIPLLSRVVVALISRMGVYMGSHP